MFELDIEKKAVLDVSSWKESVQVQRNMSKGIGRDRKYSVFPIKVGSNRFVVAGQQCV